MMKNILEYFSSLAEIPFYKFTNCTVFLTVFQNVSLDSPLLTTLAKTTMNVNLLLTTVLSPFVHSMLAVTILKARDPRTTSSGDRFTTDRKARPKQRYSVDY